MHPDLRRLAELQRDEYRLARSTAAPELTWLLERSISPDDVRRALLKETPVLSARRSLPSDTVQRARDELAAVAIVPATPLDLAFRRLYPALDVGIYCASHGTGKPSIALLPVIEEHLGQHRLWGAGAWQEGWTDAMERFRSRIAELVGGDLIRGDVARYANVSDALSAILNGGLQGRMVTAQDHFTSVAYIHAAWAERTGSELNIVDEEPDGSSPLSGLIDALTPATEVVSVATACWRTGVLLDVYALSEAIMDICPDAALIVDAYQTLGTVPLAVGRLPLRSAVLGGGVKQLRSGPGTGFAWVSYPLLEELDADRTGWFAHVEPFGFVPPPMISRDDAGKLHTGLPDPTGMVALLCELDVLASTGGGSLAPAIRRAREVTHRQVTDAVARARGLGLRVVGDVGHEERAAFFAVQITDGQVVADLASDGVIMDFRADVPGGKAGVCRISANAASFGYELMYAVDCLAQMERR